MSNAKEGQAPGPGLTRWFNPTDKVVKFRLHKHQPVFMGGRIIDPGHLDVEIPPQGEVVLADEFDAGIQSYDESGQVQSGHAPQLVKNGVRHSIHPALDPNEAAKNEAKIQERLALDEEERARRARALAEGQRAEAEARQREEREAAERAAAPAAASAGGGAGDDDSGKGGKGSGKGGKGGAPAAAPDDSGKGGKGS